MSVYRNGAASVRVAAFPLLGDGHCALSAVRGCHCRRSAQVTLLPAPATSSCLPAQFLAPLAPLLALAPTGPGLVWGPINTSTSPTAGAVWSQRVGAFDRQPPSRRVEVVARVGNLVLPTGTSLTVRL